MTNPKPYRIKPEQRGHRKPLAQNEPTERRTIRLPASLAQWWDKTGVEAIRRILASAAQKSAS